MPVGFNSPARNLFLLGSSGAQVVTNFFKSIDQSSTTDGVFTPDEIKYNYTDQKYVLAGSAEDSNSKGFGWFEKRDETGTADFVNRVESTQAGVTTTLRAMELDVNNNLIVAGFSGTTPWIAKYSNSGVLDWQSTSNSANVRYLGLTSDSNGNYYACGRTSYLLPDTQAFVEKFDSNGNPGWGKSAFMLGRDVVLKSIAANSKSEVVAVGSLEDDSAQKGYIVKIDTNTGEVLWDRTLERNISGYGGFALPSSDDGITPADVKCIDCYIDSQDQIYVVGSIDGQGTNDNGVGEFLIKYSPEGNIVWQRERDTRDFINNPAGAPNTVPFSVKSDGETGQTAVLSVETVGTAAQIILSKYLNNGNLIYRRSISKGTDELGSACLDADPSFYYILFRDQAVDGLAGEPDRYTFGKVSTSGNGLGAFEYDDGTATLIDYDISSDSENKIGRLSDGSVRQDTSDLITYPFTANKLLFDDLATQVSNKKRQMDDADSFEYSGSPAIRVADFQELFLADQTIQETIPDSEVEFTTPGTYSWTAPAGVTSVSVVCVGGGSASGGALAYRNNITVVPGTSYAVVVGAGGVAGGAGSSQSTDGGDSSFSDGTNVTIAGGGKGQARAGGSPSGTYDGGGSGGENLAWDAFGGTYNGAGAGGYSGDGGDAKFSSTGDPTGSGGGGGGAAWAYYAGGGVGIYGEGNSGGNSGTDGEGGSGGEDGKGLGVNGANSVTGGLYGGGFSSRYSGNQAGGGAVRIVWGGKTFPNNAAQGLSIVDKVRDLTKNQRHAVVNGATLNAAGYWEFDGTDDYISIPDNPSLHTEEMSWEWWMWNDTIDNSAATAFFAKRTDNTNGYMIFTQPDGSIYFDFGTPTDSLDRWSTGYSASSNLNQWIHCVMTRSSSGRAFYVNGDLYASTTDAGAYIANPSPIDLVIGADSSDVTRYNVDGRMGEVRIYPRALTASAVFQNYNSTKLKYINEPPEIAPKIGPGIVYDSNLLLNYDFGNGATYESRPYPRLANTISPTEQKIVASDAGSGDRFSYHAVAAGSDRIVVGAFNGTGNATQSGEAYIYNLDGTGEVKISASDAAGFDNFGASVAVENDKIVVGAPNVDDNGNNSGAAYIYDLDGTNEIKITASDAAADNEFGYSVAVGNNRIVVGSPDSNAAYIFDLSGNELAKIVPPDAATDDNFGHSVAVGDNRIVVAAHRDDDNGSESGSAYIFDLDGNLLTKITSSDGAADDLFGNSVAVGNNRIVVGAFGDDDNGSFSGAAYIFDLNGKQIAKMTASDGAADDRFGFWVAVGSDRIVVGSIYHQVGSNVNQGAAYIFDLDGEELTKITSSDGAADDQFGRTVAVGSGYAVIGAYGDDHAGSLSGSAYIYSLNNPLSTTVKNLSSSSYTGTLDGVTFNSAGYFENSGSSTDKIYLSDTVIPATGAFTVEWWYQLTNTNGRGGLFERESGPEYAGFSLGQGGSGNWAAVVSSTANYTDREIDLDFSSYPTLNTWYHEVAVFNGTDTMTLYRNAVQDASQTSASNVGNLDAQGTRLPLRIGYRDDTGLSNSLPVNVGEVRVYSRALTATEVSQNFNATRGKYGV